MPLYLGLDCGGSSCRALVLDESEEPVFLAQGGSANLLSTRSQTLKRSLERALEGVPEVDIVCACFAGLISEEQRQKAETLVREILPSPRLILEPDYAAALRAQHEGTEVCIIAGTGSIVCSRVDGKLRKSGGGGYLLGDEGSGFRYGRRVLVAHLRNPEATSDRTKDAIHRIFQSLDPAEITAKVYESSAPGALVASLAASLFRDAEARLPYAKTAIFEETKRLAEIVKDHVDRYPPKSMTFGLAGSVWKKGLVRESFIASLHSLIDDEVTVTKSEMPPVRGAALLARDYFKGEV